MRKAYLASLGAFLLALAVAAGAVAGSSSSPRHDFTEAATAPQTQDEYVTVVFKDPPTAQYTGGVRNLKATKPQRGQKLNPNHPDVVAYVNHLEGVHGEYKKYLNSKAPSAQVVRELELVGNAVAVKRNGTKMQTISGGPGVSRVTASWLYKPTMNVSNGLIGASDLWPTSGGQANAGDGISVGIIDTGIDDSEGQDFFACKDIEIKRVYASGGDPPPFGLETIVFDHGTHVAGTVAGCPITRPEVSGSLSGVAPGATLADYNVFPGFGSGFIAFGGSAFSHDICAALEDSVADGMDVVNMSLGGGVQGPHDLLAECTNAVADAGIVPAVAAGNSGPGDSTIGSPGNAAGALTAGASTNPHFIGIPFTATGTSTVTGGAALGDFGDFNPAVTEDYTVTVPADGCTAITNDVSGKIALIDRGTCTFTTKVRNAQNAGAVGVLIANNVAGDPSAPGHDGTEPKPTIDAAMVSKNDGAAMKPSGSVTVDGTSPQEFITTNSDIIAGFSSRGPTPFTYLIKPDLTAPGVNVYSSVFDNEFAFFQGTSMATPHLAGSAALLLARHDDWGPDEVKSALVTSAKRPVWDHVLGTRPTGVLTRGGGRAALVAADSVPVTLVPASTSFGYWSGGNKDVKATSTVVVSGSGPCVATVTQDEKPTAYTGGSIVSVTGNAPGTLTLSLDGGTRTKTPSGDYAGDLVLVCGSTTLKSPWWTRIDRQAKP